MVAAAWSCSRAPLAFRLSALLQAGRKSDHRVAMQPVGEMQDSRSHGNRQLPWSRRAAQAVDADGEKVDRPGSRRLGRRG
jgi:hypothetical protein